MLIPGRKSKMKNLLIRLGKWFAKNFKSTGKVEQIDPPTVQQLFPDINTYFSAINAMTANPYKDMPEGDHFILNRLQKAKERMLIKTYQDMHPHPDHALSLMELKAKLDQRDAMQNSALVRFEAPLKTLVTEDETF